jgi:hypothetical protein
VKPRSQFEDDPFPKVDSFFQTYSGRWRDWGEGDPFHRHNLGREYLVEAASERTKDMVMLGILLFASAWPIVLVMIEVARLHKGHR